MRRILFAAATLGAFAAASPALAGPGQCYDAYGRPIGPVYNTDHPNYAFINSVIRRGGSCTGVVTAPGRPRYRGYDGYDDGYRGRGNRYNYNNERSQPYNDPRFSREQRRSLRPDINGQLPMVEMPDRSR